MESHDSARRNEEGFGLVEVVVSMFILALLAIAFVPLMLQGIQRTSANTTIATATQIVAQQLEQLRDSGSSCNAVKTFAAASYPAVPHKSTSLQVHVHLDLPAGDVCAAPYVRTVLVRTWVTETGSPDVIAEASSLVLLDAA